MKKDIALLPLALTMQENCNLAYYEGVIQKGLKTFYDVGKALIEIRNRKLYREQYSTFEDYCREKWGISRPHAYRMIDAADIVDELSPMGDMLPESERQARALKAAPPEQRQEIWQKAIDASNGNQPTAKQIKQTIQMKFPTLEPEPEPEPEPLIRSPQVFDQHLRDYEVEKKHEDIQSEPQQPQNPMITAHRRIGKSESKIDTRILNAVEQCDFCGLEYPDNQLYYDDHHPMICGGCARKAVFALLHIDSYGDFEWYVRDRDKIIHAGLRLFRADGYHKELKEYTPARSSTAEGVDISTWGSWKRFETFSTKKALKARIEELEDDPKIVFENHL